MAAVKRMLRFFALLAMALFALNGQAQQPFFDPLQGSGSTGGFNQPQVPFGATTPQQGIPGATDITNRPAVNTQPTPPTSNADALRRFQELQLRQLNEQLDQLQAGPVQRNDFQNFVLEATGRDLPLFGSNLFKNIPTTFAPADNIPVTPDYVVGPGDEIQISGWGQINVDLVLTVDRNGNINIPRVGTVSVAGIKYQDLVPHLKTAFGRIYRNFDMTATLGRLRSIQVFVVGQAKRPGTYTISSLSSLVDAIFAAGGPSSAGSMRSIQLKRDNRVVTDLDLYDLLLSGDKSRDTKLLPGDVIQFSPVGPLVAMTGAINVPGIYELKQNTPLFDVVRWAGGLSTTAQGQKVTVERIEDRKSRKVDDFTLDVSGLSRPLKDGDLVTVYTLTPRFDNAVTLRGNVAQPGRFPWQQGMRVRDLIPSKEALMSRDYWVRRNQIVGLDPGVARIMSQQSATGTHLTLQDLNERRKREGEQDQTVGDTIRRMQTEREAARFLNPSQTSSAVQSLRLQGAARPGEQPVAQDQVRNETARAEAAAAETAKIDAAKAEAMKLVNQIKPSLMEVDWDYALVERMNLEDLSTKLVPFSLAKALQGDPENNLPLQPGDVVTIFSKDDLQVPVSRRTKYVRLEGEINHAGVYQVAPGETLRQLLTRIGGFAPNAYVFGAVFTRESTRIEQQKNLDEALNRLERDIQRNNIVRAQNVTTAEDAASLGQQYEAQQRLIARLRDIKAAGRIVLELPPDGGLKDVPDIALEDGDRFLVPPPPSMVNVMGSVFVENSFVYKPEKRVNDYLAQAGGLTKNADNSSVYVMRADGSVVSKQQSGLFLNSFNGTQVMPGDSIVVPDNLDRTTLTRNLKDIAQIFYQFGLGAAAIKVLKQ